MYLSLDEACTHVGATTFRLVAGVYEPPGDAAGSGGGNVDPAAAAGTGRLLGTAVSPPIRVLANNDVPTGAARIPLQATLPADWEGWSDPPASTGTPNTPSADVPQLCAAGASPRPRRVRSLRSNGSGGLSPAAAAAAAAVAGTAGSTPKAQAPAARGRKRSADAEPEEAMTSPFAAAAAGSGDSESSSPVVAAAGAALALPPPDLQRARQRQARRSADMAWQQQRQEQRQAGAAAAVRSFSVPTTTAQPGMQHASSWERHQGAESGSPSQPGMFAAAATFSQGDSQHRQHQQQQAMQILSQGHSPCNSMPLLPPLGSAAQLAGQPSADIMAAAMALLQKAQQQQQQQQLQQQLQQLQQQLQQQQQQQQALRTGLPESMLRAGSGPLTVAVAAWNPYQHSPMPPPPMLAPSLSGHEGTALSVGASAAAYEEALQMPARSQASATPGRHHQRTGIGYTPTSATAGPNPFASDGARVRAEQEWILQRMALSAPAPRTLLQPLEAPLWPTSSSELQSCASMTLASSHDAAAMSGREGQLKVARQAALMQHAEAQLRAARHAAASRAQHYVAPSQQQQERLEYEQLYKQQLFAAAGAAASTGLPFASLSSVPMQSGCSVAAKRDAMPALVASMPPVSDHELLALAMTGPEGCVRGWGGVARARACAWWGWRAR